MCAVILLGALSFGFNSSVDSRFNKLIWLKACLQLAGYTQQADVVLYPEDYLLSGRDNIKGSTDSFSILFNAPPDTSEEENGTDSLFEIPDTLTTESDTTEIEQPLTRLEEMALDSAARLQHFRYQRTDVPYVEMRKRKIPGFFIRPSENVVQRRIEIDSTGKFVVIKELVAGQETKILLQLPIEDYIALRLALKERQNWEALAYQYELKEGKRGLGDLIKDITDFEIPLPSVGVLSIFGEPKISLKIGGAVNIQGAWRSETTEGVTASLLGNTRNEPDFKQDVQINVSGTIGDKLNITADWNTQRTFEYENQLKIKYTGYEDEIIQSIEAGNVSLQTSPLVGGSEALFGVKALFKMGPFTLTTLASQKKGEIKEVNVSGGTTAQEFNVRAYDYSRNHYFLDTLYASQIPGLDLFRRYFASSVPEIDEQYRVVDIQVWKSINIVTPDRSRERFANAFINLDPKTQPNLTYDEFFRRDIENPVPGEEETGRFLLLEQDVDYKLYPETGFITFQTQIQDQDIIAVAYRIENGPGSQDDIFFGEFLDPADTNTTKKLVLKLVKPRNLQPQYKQAWMLQLKNIYPIGSRNVKQDGFEFFIKYEIEGQEPVIDYPTPQGPVRLLNAFGLDILDASGNPTPDGRFDFRPGFTIIPQTGEIIFPVLQPFGQNIPAALPYSIKFQDVYDTTQTFARQNKVKDKWFLTGKSSGDATAVYQLGFNVVEHSVRVRLNGRELTAGVDYVVDYNIGQLTIRNEAALVPGADLNITFEQNDLFQLASKTLLGARGIFDFSQKTKLGFSVLNLNQQTLSDKVRIGEEPLNNTIYGVDFSTRGDLPFLTRLLDNVISTREMSTFNLSGEYAYIDPDPNTKKSPIPTDDGKSIAYIDDFEGAKRTIPVGISYTSWKDLSPPDSILNLPGLDTWGKMDHKAKSFWFTILPSDVTVDQIYGDRKKVGRQDQQVTVMDYIFLPDTPGTYNYVPNLAERRKNWGGIMKLLSQTANNLIEENIEFIEFWLKVNSADPQSKFYIDIGRISEDVLPNGQLDTEDIFGTDAILDPKYDVGIDGMTDAQERDPATNPYLGGIPSTKDDPSGDNFFFNPGNPPSLFDYFNINGTQGNLEAIDVGRFPDTEDLNRNGSLDRVNSYFRYEIPLDTSAETNPFIAGGGDNAGWYLYRIPLKDTVMKVGSPSFSNVEMIRMWFTNSEQMVHLRFAEFNLVGSQWQKLNPEDTVLSVSVISREENPNYESPPGITPERDRTRPDEEVYRNEQALNLIINNLPDGESRETVRYLFRPLDVFNYSEMKLFIHGDKNNGHGSVSDTSGGIPAAEVYFRFGGDTNNYYEYRQPVQPGWNEISILFSELTAIKQGRGDSINVIVSLPVPGQPGHFYRVKGNPNLTAVKFLTVGIHNTNHPEKVGPISGEVWVNELRVIGADDSPGWAYSVSTSLKLAELMTVSFNMSESDPNFHRITDRFGSRVHSRNWGLSTDLDVLKLLPISMPESNLKLTYSHTESVGKPVYVPGTDIRVDEAVNRLEESQGDTTITELQTPESLRSEVQTVNISDTWTAANIRLRIPSSVWLIRDTFNALTFGFTYNKTFSRSPTVLSNKSWIWNANVNYGLNLSPDYFLNVVDVPVIGSALALFTDYKGVKVFYTPQNFAVTLQAKRNRNTNVTRATRTTPSQEIITRDFTTSRGFNYSWKMTEGGLINLSHTYSLNINSSLAFLERDIYGNQRPESEIWKEIFSGLFFGRDNQYQQSFELRTAPRLPSLWDINKFFNITAGYSVTYQWNFDFRQDTLGRSAGFSNKTNLGLTLRWKALTEPLFKDASDSDTKQQTQTQTTKRGRDRDFMPPDSKGETGIITDTSFVVSDTTEVVDSLLVEGPPKPSAIKNALLFFRSVAQTLFFDYENISVNFTNDNTVSKSGLHGKGTGFHNFWGLRYDEDDGPPRLFMLGLNSDVGRRAPRGNLSDAFSQRNNLEFRTSRPLWEGAKIDVNWKVGWSLNKTQNIQTDELGNIVVVNAPTSSGTLNRSFLTLPPVLVFSIFGSGIKKVDELYDRSAENQTENLSQAFIYGFETLPLLSKLGFLGDVIKYVPRPNWRITWDGLEKIFIFKEIARRVNLEHSYSSTYTEGWRINRDGIQETQTQKIEYGFTPLAGLNMTFGELWGGNLIGSIKYSTRASYDLAVTTRNITETFSRDIGITAGYSKSGFEIPLFGLALQNDIEFTFSYTNTKNSTTRFEMSNFTEEGIPQDGTTRTTLEPRVKYTLSSKVTLSIFYKRTSVEPEGAARIPPTTTNEAGLDVHISIQ